MNSLSRIAVVGAGAVGCFYGARIARHRSVAFLMRRDFDAVRENGLEVESVDGDFHLFPVEAHENTETIGPVDLVLVAVKTTANGSLPSLLAPLIKPETILATLQNGLGNEEFLASQFPEQPVVGVLCVVCINRGKPGLIRHLAHGKVELGEFTNTGVANSVSDLFTEAEIRNRIFEDIALARWRKLVWNVPFNGLSIVAGGIDTEQILSSPELVARTESLMREVIAIAAASGHEIEDHFVEANLMRTRDMGPYQPSSLIDFLSGNEVEVDSIWSLPLEHAKKHGIETPELTILRHEIVAAVASRPEKSLTS
ncbi:MAG: 2-dehydropantoate 2-reductase [Verrucomicrobiota bacterium]